MPPELDIKVEAVSMGHRVGLEKAALLWCSLKMGAGKQA